MKKGYGALASIGVLALAAGCASVKTDEDWQALRSQAAARTGVEPVWVNRDGDKTDQQVMADQALAAGLTRDEAIALALSNNPDLQARFEDLGIARADLVQAGLFTNPSVGAVFRRPDGGGSWNHEATVTMPISDLWQVPLRKKAARHNLEATTQGILNDIVDVTAEVQRTYNAIQYAENSATTMSGTGGRQPGSGAAFSGDVDTVTRQIEAESFRTAATIERARLARLLGLDDASNVTLACAFQVPPSTSLDENALIQQAMANNPNIMMYRHRTEALEKSIQLQKWRVIGDVNVGAGALRDPHGSSNNHDGHDALDNSDDGDHSPDAKWYYGPSVALQIPLFDQNQAGIAKAEYALRQAEKQLRAEEARVREQVRSAVNRYRLYEAQSGVYRDTVVPARQRSLSEFRGGPGYAGAMSEMARTETLAGSATRGQLDALADLEKATGMRLLKGCDAAPSPAMASAQEPVRNPVRNRMSGQARLDIQGVDIQPRAGAAGAQQVNAGQEAGGQAGAAGTAGNTSAPGTAGTPGNTGATGAAGTANATGEAGNNAANANTGANGQNGNLNMNVNSVTSADGTRIEPIVADDCLWNPDCNKPRVVFMEVGADGQPVVQPRGQ